MVAPGNPGVVGLKPHLWPGFLGLVQTLSSTPAALRTATCSCTVFALSPLNCQSAAPANRSLCFSPPRAEKPISVPRLSASEPPPNFPNLFFSPPRDRRTISPADPCRSRSDAAGHSGDSFVRQKSKSDCLCPSSLVFRSAAASRSCELLSHATASYLRIHGLNSLAERIPTDHLNATITVKSAASFLNGAAEAVMALWFYVSFIRTAGFCFICIRIIIVVQRASQLSAA